MSKKKTYRDKVIGCFNINEFDKGNTMQWTGFTLLFLASILISAGIRKSESSFEKKVLVNKDPKITKEVFDNIVANAKEFKE